MLLSNIQSPLFYFLGIIQFPNIHYSRQADSIRSYYLANCLDAVFNSNSPI
ncbi:hypothetical protein IF2G_00516 [Cordyceps javanica]|nr:hypothetical protein IF2G_00516 [Cordyceps javanica]